MMAKKLRSAQRLSNAVITAARPDRPAQSIRLLADAAYGNGFAFRQRLRSLGLEFFLQIDLGQLVGWAQPVAVARKRKHWHVEPGQPPAKALAALWADQKPVQWHSAQQKPQPPLAQQKRVQVSVAGQ